MFIELHLIQNFAPANLNRDDTNNPKDCEFGGHRRARISSQAFKRAIRREPIFAQTTKADNGERSKRMTLPIVERLIDAGKSADDAQLVANAAVAAYYSKKEKMEAKKPDRTLFLVYFASSEIDSLVKLIIDQWEEVLETAREGKPMAKMVKQLVDDTKERTSAPDIALFGRMLADKTELNVDAACQVAHAISTHRVNMEMDFYTAVDDLQTVEEDEGAGAGMMGFTNFNSSCFYRYACIDFNQLATNLGGDRDLARRTVEGFLRAAIDAIPTGKQNSFAAQNPTSLALALVREDGKSWNLANAFEEPVRAGRETGIIAPSIEALDGYWSDLSERRDDAQFETVAVWTDSSKHQQALTSLAGHHKTKLSDWIGAVTAALPKE
jgi:CRISPR system Cascade subunit CasC